ncbi:uncharacterized protein LOC131162941 isoform X2 [Malania oleifera]|uniref:uncharacterized protein LOC131162941 isoform X2 n=1 Tax=Malania oleifera TaxID=397392 RepID=UPI0025ADCC62|nr:uncharacterized protein LOC131162941 isoform X2 [Malania oleifera]
MDNPKDDNPNATATSTRTIIDSDAAKVLGDGKDAENFSSSKQPTSSQKEDTCSNANIPTFPSYQPSSGDFQMFPIMYPAFVPGLVPLQSQEQMNRGAGIYAVPVLPYMGPLAGIPSTNLIPLTYNIPTSTPEAGAAGEEHRQAGPQQQQQQQQQQPQPQPAPQRQVVVRRFQIAFQLDLLLILKLAAVIFLFNQDGSRQRLVLLVFFASLVYLYQTGALTPLVRWLSEGMQRAAAPPQQQRHAVRAENAPAAARQGNDNADVAEGLARAENENPPLPGDVGNGRIENENIAEPGEGNGANHWWGIVKEIQMIVFGFITSLLPGFHNHVD